MAEKFLLSLLSLIKVNLNKAKFTYSEQKECGKMESKQFLKEFQAGRWGKNEWFQTIFHISLK